MVVRNPFERLLSAYRDVLEKENKYMMLYQNIKNPNIRNRFLLNGANTEENNFSHFLKFLIYEGDTEKFNEHWRPMYQLCFPSYVKYSSIIKFDTIQNDIRYLLTRFEISGCKESFPELFRKFETNHDIMDEYYSHITEQDRSSVGSLYLPDFLLFNYTLALP